MLNEHIPNLEYIGVGKRYLAFLIDTVIFGVLFWIFMMVFAHPCIDDYSSDFSIGATFTVNQREVFYGLCGIAAQFYFLTILAYYIVLEWKCGGTIGKLAMGIRVVKLTGEQIDLKASIMRNVLRIIDFLPFLYHVGAISIWSSKIKQRVGDRLAKTVVVSRKSITVNK